jgi:hypothetical protein
MSRDFLVTFGSKEDAAEAESTLASTVSSTGKRIFSVDNRGDSLFCMLIYTDFIDNDFLVMNRRTTVREFNKLVSHINIENGVHQSEGYFLDTGAPRTDQPIRIPLSQVFCRVVDLFSSQALSHPPTVRKSDQLERSSCGH